jgi:capsular polysaccharide biosynthesis protein
VTSASGSRRIYLTRKRTSRRKVTNEAEVSAALVRRGFDVIDFEGLNLAEQIRLSAEANLFVSIHGAGLTNIMFMPPGSTVVELYPEIGGLHRPTPLSRIRGPSVCYRRLAAVMSQQYHILFCPTDSSIVDKADVTVDINRLDAVVGRVLGGY